MKIPLSGAILLALASSPLAATKPPKCAGLPATAGITVEQGVITGTPGNDVIVGTAGDDTIFGLGGDDVICGGAGDDNIAGGEGSDVIYAGPGDDDIYGDNLAEDDADFDRPVGFAVSPPPATANRDRIYGGAGADNISGGDGDDLLDGGDGRDELSGDQGQDRLLGGNGKDYLYGDDGPDTLFGGEGNDMLHGGDGPDDMHGGRGSDELFGDADEDALEGGPDRKRDRLHRDDEDSRSADGDPGDICYFRPDDGEPGEREIRCEPGSAPREASQPGNVPPRGPELHAEKTPRLDI
jgi:hypothetical protein